MSSENDFSIILLNLLSNDNDIRSKSEEIYETVAAEERAQYLLHTLINDTSEEVRQLSAVLLRRLLFSCFEEISKKLPSIVMEQFKIEILMMIPKDISNVLRKKVCDAAAELAKNYIDDNGVNQWPQFLNFLFESVNSSNESLKECALLMFSTVPGIFGNQQSQYLDVIKQMLINCLCGSTPSIDVKIAAVKASCAFILAHESEKPILRHMGDCVLPMMHVLTQCIELENDDGVVKSFIEISEKCPQILRPHFEPLIELCLRTSSNAEKPDNWKHLTLEIVISLAENAPSTFRKRGAPYMQSVVSQLLLMMTDLPDDPNWALIEQVDEEDEADSNSVIGESSLDRLACSIGGRAILPFIISNISQMLQNSDWKHRFAALMAISAVGEGCHDQMTPLLKQIVDSIVPFLTDSHPRVRYAVCNALGQMATDFSPEFEESFHSQVIPALLTLLDDYGNPRVQAHAGAALVNFFEECPQKIVINYMDGVVRKIEEVLNVKVKELMEKGSKLVLEQIIVTLASVADSAQENFQQYYDRFMPCIKYIIANATNKDYRLLRGKCIECISLIGLAVGKEKFCIDANDIMTMLLQTQTGEIQLEDDDPQLAYMISAWARICKILGSQFEPYLPYVMGPVLKAASIKIEVALLDNDDMKVIEDDNDWQCVSLGDQQTFGIKTVGLEEKATACQMLVCYAKELKGGFVNYVEDTAKIMVPMLKFYFHDGVRTAAAESIPFLIESAKVRGENYVSELWNFIFPELLKAIETEPEKDVLSELMASLSASIDKLGLNCCTDKQLQELMEVLSNHLKDHFERQKQRQEKRNDEDYDDGVEETLIDEDDEDVYILSKVADILHSLFIAYRDGLYPYFDSIYQHFINLTAPGRSWTDLQWAICVMDDVIEHGGNHCTKYQSFFLPLLLNGIQNQHPEIRQAAAYGWGILGKYGGESFAKACSESVPFLVQMIQHSNSRLAENIGATENAISAVTKIIQFNGSMIDINQMLSLWLQWLPVWEDDEEIPHVYGFLCFLLEHNHPAIIGDGNSNIPRIIAIMAEVFARNAIDVNSDLGQKMISYVKFIKGNDIFSNCFQQLTIEQQNALKQLLII